MARRRKTNQRTARENIDELVDPGRFIEYGALAFAAQRRRRTLDDLIKNTPADGLIAGIATVNAEEFGADAARCMVIAYDYTVLAGTQGTMNHKKTTACWTWPRVAAAAGVLRRGRRRPAGRHRLSRRRRPRHADLPAIREAVRPGARVGIVSGRCFAGNAAMLGCCDVIIATRNASIGMGGPAMIEGGGLGVYQPEEVGPVSFQRRTA